MTNLVASLTSSEQRKALLFSLETERRRRAARRDFTEYAKLCGFDPAPHHRALIRLLERVARHESRRAMVFMPPGSAKSTYSSILFPAWFLGQGDQGNVLAASHSTELAERFGRKVRNLVSEHSQAMGFGVSTESSAAGRWETTAGREYYAAGVGVGIAGFRSALSLIDDPFRSRQDADSKLIRDRVWEWYNDDLDTRLVPGGAQVLVMTRWHEDDLAGRLLARDGKRWDVLSIPAIAGYDDPLGREPGEWLWEGEYGYADRLREKCATTDTRSWSALYQQEPTPDTGDFFRREWLIPVADDLVPTRDALSLYGGSDYAVTESGGDYTVHGVVGLDGDGNPWLVDLYRRQAASPEWVEAFCALVLKWSPIGWAEEAGQIRAGVGPFLEAEMTRRRAYVARERFPTRGDKAVRAQSFRGLIATRGLRIPANAPWRADLEAELLRFPAGVHDDIVDALGLVGQLVAKMSAPRKPEKPAPRAPRDWFDEPDDAGSTDWRLA